MDYYQNARLAVHSRERSASFNMSAKTAAEWVHRCRAAGMAGLRDRSSRPHRLHRPTAPALVERVEMLRRQRWTGYRIAPTMFPARVGSMCTSPLMTTRASPSPPPIPTKNGSW